MPTGPKLVEGVVYVVQSDNPYGSDFKEGDRVKMIGAPNVNGSAAFKYEDGRQALCRYLRADALKKAPKKHGEESKPKVLTEADIRHGVTYVTLKDFPNFSDFKKGDRIKLKPDTMPSDHRFVYEDGREPGHGRPYVSPEYLAFVEAAAAPVLPQFKAATLEDLKPGAVFKVEAATVYHRCPIGSLVQHAGGYSDVSSIPFMQVITLEERGLKQYVALADLSLVVEGKGEPVLPKPKRGSGTAIKTAARSDSYNFILRDCGASGYYVEAGCRWFSMAEAEEHWQNTRKGTDLGAETLDILELFKSHIRRIAAAKLRKGV